MKKKKKKKTGFDLDAALAADGGAVGQGAELIEDVQIEELKLDAGDNGLDDDLDLEDFGKKKKKKKKKPFNEAEVLGEDNKEPIGEEESKEDAGDKQEDDLDLDFSSKKKKRSKKKDLNEILDKADDEEDKENGNLGFLLFALAHIVFS